MRLTTPIWCTEPCDVDGCPERSAYDGLCAEHHQAEQDAYEEHLWEMEQGR